MSVATFEEASVTEAKLASVTVYDIRDGEKCYTDEFRDMLDFAVDDLEQWRAEYDRREADRDAQVLELLKDDEEERQRALLLFAQRKSLMGPRKRATWDDVERSLLARVREAKKRRRRELLEAERGPMTPADHTTARGGHTHERRCSCGDWFRGANSRATYCSAACRQRAYRARRATP